MPVDVTTKHGVRLQCIVCDGSGFEVASAPCNSVDLAHKFKVSWQHSGRSTDVLVTSEIVHGSNLMSYGGYYSINKQHFNCVISSQPQSSHETLVAAGTVGQVVIDCGSIAVLDVWAQTWDVDNVSAQLSVDLI